MIYELLDVCFLSFQAERERERERESREREKRKDSTDEKAHIFSQTYLSHVENPREYALG